MQITFRQRETLNRAWKRSRVAISRILNIGIHTLDDAIALTMRIGRILNQTLLAYFSGNRVVF